VISGNVTNRFARVAFWVALSAPGLYQIILLLWAIGGRFGYPYDLEWMEGGVLHGADRIADGDGHYPPPSVDFIPFLYTPLYPGLLAVLGGIFGLSYQLGRAVSVLALCGIAWTVIAQGLKASPTNRSVGLAGALLGLGLFAAWYPYVEGWYDIVRGDTLFLLMITASIYTLSRWAREDEGPWAQVRIASIGAILGLSFFCKPTTGGACRRWSARWASSGWAARGSCRRPRAAGSGPTSTRSIRRTTGTRTASGSRSRTSSSTSAARPW
jgi:hypothetical protein